MSFPSKSMQIMCIASSVVVMTSSVVVMIVMTSSVTKVIPGHELNCDNKIAANTMENPNSNWTSVKLKHESKLI